MAGLVERLLIAAPAQSGGGRVIASPFQFYLDGNDNLRIEGWNSKSGVVLKCAGRFVDEKGEVDVFEFPLALTADRIRTVADFALARGFLLNLVVTATLATPLLGQTFARVSVIRGFSGATIELGTLLQGYVTGALGIAWPGSVIQQSHEIEGYARYYAGTIPAPGSAINEVVPTNAHWRVLAAHVSLSTDATAGNRQPFLQFFDNAGNFFTEVFAVGTCPPSSIRAYEFAERMPDTLTQPTSGTMTAYPYVELSSGAKVVVGANLFAAGDQWFLTPRFMLQERLEV